MIPTNVVTGFLGVGKTTAILDLLQRKPGDERWAVLVNEYGEVSIDQAIMAGAAPPNVTVREVGGGCICCVTAPYLQVALHLLLTEAKPSRLIVETTGLGHPGRLLDTLRTQYADRLDVRATLAMVAPDDVNNPEVLTNPIFREQVDLADVLVLNKLDTASDSELAGYRDWANELFPPKLLIAATEQGRLDPVWLDLGGRRSLTIVEEHDPALPTPRNEPAPLPRKPVRRESTGTVPACGWIFSPEDVFDENRLLALLGGFPGRLKGVFRVAEDRLVVNRAGGRTTVTPTQYQHDSRVEMFGLADWLAIEAGLLACLI